MGIFWSYYPREGYTKSKGGVPAVGIMSKGTYPIFTQGYPSFKENHRNLRPIIPTNAICFKRNASGVPETLRAEPIGH